MDVPPEINTLLGGESQDFIVKANRIISLRGAFAVLGFGLAILAFMSIFVVVFLGPIFTGKEVHFTSNGVPTVASLGNLGPIIVPALVIGVFVLMGLCFTIAGIYSFFAKGAWYIGTEKRLIIIYGKNKIRSIDWEQFSGDIEINGSNEKGIISLKMRTGKMVSRKNAPNQYVPDIIYISEIPNAFAVEQICRKRIKENDPTPANTKE